MCPLVSILVPIYKVEGFIEKCARSLFEQTYSSIEYIFVNDCTPDNSMTILRKVLQKYPQRSQDVKIINHKENRGLSATRNTALEVAKGEFLLFVDSDDYIDKDTVERLVATSVADNADIIVYDMRYVYKDTSYTIHQNIKTSPQEYVCQLLTYQVGVTIWGKLIKRSLFVENDIQFIEGLNFGEDYVTSPRIAYYASRIAYCPDVYYNYVQCNETSYTIGYRSKNVDDLKRALDILSSFFVSKQDYPLYKDAVGEAFLINKVKLLIAICLHYKQMQPRLDEVSGLYQDKYDLLPNISHEYRLLLWMSGRRLFFIMRTYVVLGYKIKQFIKDRKILYA